MVIKLYSNNLICEIIKFIDINLNRKITISELEKRFYYNRYYIMKLFKKEIGVTIFEYINILRTYNASQEIKNNNYSLTKISLNNGFYSLEYFSEIFKKITGLTPSVFKKFWNNNSNISDCNLNKVRNYIISSQEFISRKEKYLKNTKPTTLPIKKLSIFK